jgi:signal transduction histidine kinase
MRRRLLGITALGALVLVVVLTGAFNLVLRDRLRADADGSLRARTAARLASLTVVDGRLSGEEAPDEGAGDARTWVYSGRRALERPPGPPELQREADALAGGPRRYATLPADDVRLLATPARQGGRRVGTVVVAISTAPYERTARTALIASAVLGVLVLVAILAGAWWAIGAALRPVARMTASAARWGEHDLERRFALGSPHDELTTLAATFDRLLDRLAGALRREQRLTAEISHELRTPLSRLLAEVELALRPGRAPDDQRAALEAVRAHAREMGKTLDALLAAARARGDRDARGDAAAAAARAVAAAQPAAAAHGVALELRRPAGPVTVAAEPELVERALAPLLDNACRYAKARVDVAVRRVDGTVELVVHDDGPGVAPAERERIFEAGVRGNDHPSGGAGLGLALARRLAAAGGGEVAYADAPGGTFVLRLPPS